MKKKILKAKIKGDEKLAKLYELEDKIEKSLEKPDMKGVQEEIKKSYLSLKEEMQAEAKERKEGNEKSIKAIRTKSPACRIDGEDKDDCVSRKIPELIDEGYSREQAVAIANSICSVPCSERDEPKELRISNLDEIPRQEEVEVKGLEKIINTIRQKASDVLKVDVQNEYFKVRFTKRNNRGQLVEVEPEDLFKTTSMVTGLGGSTSASPLLPSNFNKVEVAYPTSTKEVYTYYLNSSVKGVITIIYNDANKTEISSAERTS